MEKIELNHWFVSDNGLSISLMRYFVKINICQNDKCILYRLEVFEEGRIVLTFNFNSLSDAIHFTEQIIEKCKKISEIVEQYTNGFQKNEHNNTIKDTMIKNKKFN